MSNEAQLGVEYELIRGAAIWFEAISQDPGDPVGRLALIEATGDDRMEWLQGQVTNDLRGLAPGSQIDFCMLKPTGQIVADCRMWVFEDRCLISVPRLCVAGFLERFESMVIMEDVEARNLSGTLRLITVQGPKAHEMIASIEPHLPAGIRALPSDRSGSGGVDLWVPASAAEQLRGALSDVPEGSLETLAVASLEAGIPVYGVDIDGKTLLPELGKAFEQRNVSYTKGCYTGQEIVARIHSRGHTNRTWAALVRENLGPEASEQAAAKLQDGILSRWVWSPRLGPITRAMVRNELASEGTRLEVLEGGEAVVAVVRCFPLL